MGPEYYLAIDVGATKTLFAVFEAAGEVVCEKKIKTNPDYRQFKSDLETELKELGQFKFTYCCCAVPATINFETGVAIAFGNESWQNVPVQADLQALLPGVKILIHNDAKLAALSETILLHKKYKKVLYLTISTGIGGGIIIDDVISKDFENFEPGQMVFKYDGQSLKWEAFASGRALKERYGKLASEIDDPAVWQDYTKTLVPGLEDLLATVRPDAVVIGGSVGAYFEKFQPFLEEDLSKINNPLVPTPPLIKARRPEEAVIYGCY
ncbi:MAG TPA: ROK family protein, partial [Candidatus Saccharimonadales bacterium]|nr:ROK family protein [Candidatus Saccharimonadales bacterium]